MVAGMILQSRQKGVIHPSIALVTVKVNSEKDMELA